MREESARGLSRVQLELSVAGSPELQGYLVKLTEHNVGDAVPTKVEEIITWSGVHGAMAQTGMFDPPTISIDFPDY